MEFGCSYNTKDNGDCSLSRCGTAPHSRCHTDRNNDEPARSYGVERIPHGVASSR